MDTLAAFDALGIDPRLIQVLKELGYEIPTPIQEQTIPLLLAGRDVIGQAQTGTGKTAAFALPMLQRLNLSEKRVQGLVLTPTRELAIQVAEAIQIYSRNLPAVHVMPIYGGDSIGKQMGRLRSGLHIVVGTPGRIMDHLQRETLNLSSVKTVIIDEADEMLRMGFIEDVEWILGHTPAERQTALFSATMPPAVRRIGERHLSDPITVEVRHATLTVPTVEQHYIQVPEKLKVDVLTHLLEVESVPGEAILIFVRTKVGAAGLAEKLQARGYTVESLHGDLTQAQREGVIRRLRDGQLDMVTATDVAARGLDIDHIGRVINFDIPYDPESYVHRIGRTARAGRAGKAILLVTPRETRMMREIERFTGQKLTAARLPTRSDVVARRASLLKTKILKTLQDESLDAYLALVEELAEESGRDFVEIAAAAARLARGDKPLEPADVPLPVPESRESHGSSETVNLWISVGRINGIRPADIVGAIANEADIPGRLIGPMDIRENFSLVGIPQEYQQQVLQAMAGTKIRGQPANIRPAHEQERIIRHSSHRETARPSPSHRPAIAKKKPDAYAGKKRKAK
jgi:ATP-dependent RNA helicase DeaD